MITSIYKYILTVLTCIHARFGDHHHDPQGKNPPFSSYLSSKNEKNIYICISIIHEAIVDMAKISKYGQNMVKGPKIAMVSLW